MGIKRRASSVPASNRSHKQQHLGYASSGSAEKPYVSLKDLRRSGDQIDYLDLAFKSTYDCRQLLREGGALTCFNNRGVICDEEEACEFLCWD